MKLKGLNYLSPSTRANILLEKDLKQVTGETPETIALKYGTTPWIVKQMKYDNIGAEARKLYRKKREKLKEIALDATVAVINRGRALVDKADSPKFLSGLAAFGKLTDTVMRLEEQSPTAIVKNNSPEVYAIEFIKILLADMDFESAVEEFKRANLAPLLTPQQQENIATRLLTGNIKLDDYD